MQCIMSYAIIYLYRAFRGGLFLKYLLKVIQSQRNYDRNLFRNLRFLSGIFFLIHKEFSSIQKYERYLRNEVNTRKEDGHCAWAISRF